MSSPTEASSISSASDGGRWERDAVFSLAIAVVASALTFVVYSPRLYLWRGVGDLIAHRSPEYGRANALLNQVEAPWGTSFDPMHRVLAWRKLFPVIWHYAHLPPRWLLAMPHVGCVAVLWLVAWLTRRRLGGWAGAWLATLLFAPLPWFFVSTAWLGYFDSWFTLGLVAVGFVPSRWILAAACLLTPWIDERFLLALPLTLVVRAAALTRVERRAWPDMVGDLAVAALASLPYPAIRALALLSGEPDTNIYIQAHVLTVRDVPATRFFAALWSGFRAGWLMIGAAVWLWAKRVGWRWGLALALVLTGTAAGGLFIAADMSRTMMMISPTLLLGAWLWETWRPPTPRWLLPSVVVANFLLPATHELWFAQFHIEHFPAEFARLREPLPPALAASEMIAQAVSLAAENMLPEARKKLDAAIALDPRYAIAFTERAALRLRQQDVEGALDDADQALRIDANVPNALFLRGLCRAIRGDRAAAAQDVQRALDMAGPGWLKRPQAEQLLKQLTEARAAPMTPAQP